MLKSQNFADAKKNLYEALYIDQTDMGVLSLIHECNKALEQKEISMDFAIAQAIKFDSLGFTIPKEVVADHTEPVLPKTTPEFDPISEAYTKPEETQPIKPVEPPKVDEKSAASSQLSALIAEGDKAF